MSQASKSRELRELALLFLKLGGTAFGGPAAHIAMMEEEVVTRRRWLSRAEFLDLLGAAHLIPGPNSTELAIHIGRARTGWPGLIVAGSCFILPAFLIVGVLAWAYARLGFLPETQGILGGVKPVVIAVVASAILRLATPTFKTPRLVILGLLAMAAILSGVHELVVLFLSGLAALLIQYVRDLKNNRTLPSFFPWLTPPFLPGVLLSLHSEASGSRLVELFLIFLKIGSVLFGSGYVLLAFLKTDLVEARGWLSTSQLLDAVAIGQVTPGPLFTTATFAGYLVAGPGGALLATLGIFLPAFLFVALSAPFLPRLRRSPKASAFLDGVNVASLALMASVLVPLAKTAFADTTSIAIGIGSFVALSILRLNSAWLMLIGAILGFFKVYGKF